MKIFILLLLSINLFASQESFGEFHSLLLTYLEGNLGKLLALLGFLGTFISYLIIVLVDGTRFVHKVLFIGTFISLLAGAIGGIAGTFFNIGLSSFG